MKMLYSRCAGLDVHKKNVCACIRISEGQQTSQEMRTFGTFTEDLEGLRDWLQEHKVSHVAMESTGVFWIPVWNVLEQCETKVALTLINPPCPATRRIEKTANALLSCCNMGC